MTSRAHAVLTSSDEPNWRTPGWLRAALCREFDLQLDVAADPESALVPLFLGLGSPYGIEDALTLDDWSDVLTDRQAAFCNPPYSRRESMPIEPWIQRMAATGRTRTMIGVIPHSPQTGWWRRYLVGFEDRATEIRRFPFRVKFDPPSGYVVKAKDGKIHGANVNTVIAIWRPTHEYPRALPWAPFERYWVPAEFAAHGKYHDVELPLEEPDGD